MKVYNSHDIKNIALLGNDRSGKTTLTECLLYHAGALPRRGRITQKNTVSDYFPVEQEYGYSVFATAFHVEWKGKKLNLIDCPGSDDFVGAAMTALNVTDTALLLLNGAFGVEVGTQNHFRYTEKLGKPVIFLVNQLDHENCDYELILDDLRNVYGPKVVPVQYPLATGPAFNSLIDVILMKKLTWKEEGGEPLVEDIPAEKIERSYDLVVVGGGPAGSAAAIYSARKGLHVAIVAERLGGQVNDTVGIENLISVPKTTGPELAQHLGEHIEDYPIDLFVNRKVEQVNLDGEVKELHIKGGEVFLSKQIVIATGAGWRKLNVDGEADYLGRGVHFCPHCDGPFYKGKRVAVVGGGNSGVEAAIDLAGICSHVTVLEFADHLLADEVLQEKAKSLGNVEIFTLSQTTAVLGDGQKVTGVRVKDRTNDAEREIELDGIFVQIGLAPNTQPFAESLELSPRREIVVDATCRTSKVGVYAAGDCTTVPYKQIIVAMGEGAKAALSAFDDRVRNKV